MPKCSPQCFTCIHPENPKTDDVINVFPGRMSGRRLAAEWRLAVSSYDKGTSLASKLKNESRIPTNGVRGG